MKTKLLLLLFLICSFANAQNVYFHTFYPANVTATSASINCTADVTYYSTVTYRIADSAANLAYAQSLGSTGYSPGTEYPSYNITGLLPNTTYYYNFKGVNGQYGFTTTSYAASFTTLPSVATISNVSATPVQGTIMSSTVNYSITANSSGTTTSVVKYGTSSNTLDQQVTGFTATGNNATTNSASIPGLLPNTQYFYRVEATNAQGTVSNTVSSFTTPAALISFSNLTATAVGQTTATVSVDLANVCNNSTYHIQYANNSNFASATDNLFSSINASGTKTHDLTALSSNTTYYYRFYSAANTACNNAAVFSSTSTFRTSGPVVAPSISLVSSSSLTANSATINYSLNANNGATTSVIKFGLSSNSLTNQVPGFIATGNSIAAGTAQISGLLAGKVYYYQVESTNSAGTSLGSVLSFTTTALPFTMSDVSASLIGSNSATVSLNLNNVCAGGQYKLVYSTTSNFAPNTFTEVSYTAVTAWTGTATNHIINGLSPNTTYYVYFYSLANQACNTAAVFSGTVSFRTTAPLPSVTNISSVAPSVSSTINYSLNSNGFPTTSRVLYGLTANSLTGEVTGTAQSNYVFTSIAGTAAIAGLLPNTQYFYRVQATNQFGTVQSQLLNFTTGPAPIAFSNLNARSIGTTTATVDVDLANVCAGTQYTLQYATASAFNAGVVNLAQPTTSTGGTKTYDITGLTANTTYYFRFYGSAGATCNTTVAYSDTASFKTTSNPIIAFSNLNATAITSTTATLNVDLSNVCAGAQYRLQFSASPTFSSGVQDILQATTSTGGTKTYDITGLTPNTVYYFRYYSAANTACNPTQIISATGIFRADGPVMTPTAPTIILTSSTPDGDSSTIDYTLIPNNAATTSVIRYGLSAASLSSQTPGFSASASTIITNNTQITGLLPNTQYFYAIDATNSVGTTTSTGNFTTKRFKDLNASNITPTTATVNVNLLNNCATGSYRMQYSTSTTFNPVLGSALKAATTAGVVSENLTGLIPNTTYYYRFYIGAYEGCNNAVVFYSATGSFTTSPAAPLIIPAFTQVPAICLGETLAALPTTSNNGITGTWSPATMNASATTTYTFTPAANQSATTKTMTIVVNRAITPIFASLAPICGGTATSPLLTTSIDGITGTWAPAFNNTTTTTYTFTPDAGQCAATTTMVVNVIPTVIPTFNAVAPICVGAPMAILPTLSTNGVAGTWSPALNNTATTTYTFTPTAIAGKCFSTATMIINVNSSVTPTFTQVAAICSGGTLAPLPTTSTNGVTGTWSPALNTTATTTYTFTPTAGQCASTKTMVVTVNSSITPTFTQVAPICSGSSFSLPTTSINGITGTWAPALNTTATTTYTFTPTAGQCASTKTMTITVNSSVTPTFTQVAPICSGSSFSLPTTSTNGITGTWAPALNNTATTTYTFTPTVGQCASTKTMTVTVNSSVTPTFTQVAAICSGSSFSLPTTSTNGISGTWSPALNTTATTTYTFTPTAGQCASTKTMTVTVNSNVTPTFTQVAAICSGSSFSLPTTSTNGISGTWSPALNNTATTTYTFTPTAGQCASTKTMTVTVNSAAIPTGIATQIFTQGATIANLVVSPANVIWYATNADAVANSNPLLPTTLLVNATTYYAVNVSGSCRSTPLAVTVSVALGLENQTKVEFSVYPNPVNEVLNIETINEVKTIEIYNIQGQKVLVSTQKQINVSNLAAGVYMVRVQDADNAIATKKIIKK